LFFEISIEAKLLVNIQVFLLNVEYLFTDDKILQVEVERNFGVSSREHNVFSEIVLQGADFLCNNQ